MQILLPSTWLHVSIVLCRIEGTGSPSLVLKLTCISQYGGKKKTYSLPVFLKCHPQRLSLHTISWMGHPLLQTSSSLCGAFCRGDHLPCGLRSRPGRHLLPFSCAPCMVHDQAHLFVLLSGSQMPLFSPASAAQARARGLTV